MNYAQRRHFWVELIHDATLLPAVLARAFVDYGETYQEIWSITAARLLVRQDYDWFTEMPAAVDLQALINRHAARPENVRRLTKHLSTLHKRKFDSGELDTKQSYAEWFRKHCVTPDASEEQRKLECDAAELMAVAPIRRIWYTLGTKTVDLAVEYHPSVSSISPLARYDLKGVLSLTDTHAESRPLSTMRFALVSMWKTVLPTSFYDTTQDYSMTPEMVFRVTGGHDNIETTVYKKEDPKTVGDMVDFSSYAVYGRGDYGMFAKTIFLE